MITLDTTIARSNEVLASEVGGELVMLDSEKSRYHGLNSTGTDVWNLLCQPMTVRELCAQLAAKYEVSAPQCEEDLLSFVADLFERKVILILEAPAP